MLIPLWVALALLAWGDKGPELGNTTRAPSDLGLSAAQIEGVYVDFVQSPPVVSTGSGPGGYWGMSCRTTWTAPLAPEFKLACSAMPDKTAILFTEIWPMHPLREAYLIRHEVQHIIDGPGADNVWGPADEVAPTAAGCAVADIGAVICVGG